MKKKLFLVLLTVVILICSSCGKDPGSKDPTPNPPVDESENSGQQENTTDDSAQIAAEKNAAIAKLDELVNPVIDKIMNEDLKTAVRNYYNTETNYINGITDLSDAKAAAAKVLSDTESFVKDTLVPLALTKLDAYVLPIVEKIPDENLKNSASSFYGTEKAKLSSADALADVPDLFDEIVTDVENYIKTESAKIIVVLKDKAIEELDTYLTALIAKIPNEKLKADTRSFYETEKKKLEAAATLPDLNDAVDEIKDDLVNYAVSELVKIAVTELDPYAEALIGKIPSESVKADVQNFYDDEIKKLDGCETCEAVADTVKEIKDDVAAFALTETKKYALEELDAVVEAGLEKLPNDEIREELSDFYDEEVEKLNAVKTLESVKPTLETVLSETGTFIKGLVVRTMKEYLSELFTYNTADPFDYLPEAMRPSYAAALGSATVQDYSSFVNVKEMPKHGYGEQWQMVVENLDQLMTVVKAMNGVGDVMTTVANAMNIYIENTTTDELENTLDNETLSAKLTFKDGLFLLEVTFKASYSAPAIGSISPVVKLAMDIEKGEKAVYIKLNDANVVKYTMTKDVFELALTYGITVAGKSASRTSFFERRVDDDGNVYGHIYEYTTLEGADRICACADFYVKDGYVSVVGNKASGMVGFKGYINELYSEEDGTLLGYKVEEEATVAGVTGTYHTLWFNLRDVDGIQSVKVTEKTKNNDSGLSTVDVYLNGSSSLFVPTYNKKFGFKTSRKYDIELRSRFCYSIEDGKTVVTEVKVPMIFIQDDNSIDTNYTDFPKDFEAANGFIVKVIVEKEDLKQIRTDYETLIPIFKANKDSMSSEKIISYLNSFSS